MVTWAAAAGRQESQPLPDANQTVFVCVFSLSVASTFWFLILCIYLSHTEVFSASKWFCESFLVKHCPLNPEGILRARRTHFTILVFQFFCSKMSIIDPMHTIDTFLIMSGLLDCSSLFVYEKTNKHRNQIQIFEILKTCIKSVWKKQCISNAE